MKLNPSFLNLFSDITIKAAVATYPFIGLGDKNKADHSAVEVMRNASMN